MSEAGAGFQLIGGSPAVDLVNTLDWRFRETGAEELLGSYADLLRLVRESGLLPAKVERQMLRSTGEPRAAAVVRRARGLREALATVLYGVVGGTEVAAGAVEVVERMVGEARRRQRLVEAGVGMRWSWEGMEGEAMLPVWMLAVSAGELLTSEAQMARLRACGSEACRWLFVDMSRNGARRWCDMAVCGNRVKARRFRERAG